MIIGLPREIKDGENRVGLTPALVAELVRMGHNVLVESGAGEGSGFPDEQYSSAGAMILRSHADVFAGSGMIVKVKEPLPAEYDLLREDLILFAALHLAADEGVTRALTENKVSAIATETVERPDGSLPLLQPMSGIAGRMSIQVGAHYLEKTQGGRGVLLGGVPGVAPSRVVVVGGGVVGTNAAQMALGVGANVTILDADGDRLRFLDCVLHGRLVTLKSNSYNVAEAVREADLVIGGVLVHGARTPQIVTAEMIAGMRPGSVVVDVAIDQGGCFATSHPTAHSNPVFEHRGVLHYCVPNIPAALPRTSTLALTNATQPYVLELARYGFERAVQLDASLARGVNTYKGQITYEAVANVFGMACQPLSKLLR